MENRGLADAVGVSATLTAADGTVLAEETVDVASGAVTWTGPYVIEAASFDLRAAVDDGDAVEECDEHGNVEPVAWPCP